MRWFSSAPPAREARHTFFRAGTQARPGRILVFGVLQ